MTLALTGIAQNQLADIGGFFSCSALSNSPPLPPGAWGGFNYYRTTKPFLPGMPTYTNLLEVYFWLPASVENISLLEMEPDGSFTIVADLTEQQRLTLTTNQIHSMVAGNFYMEVDLEEGSYLGQLAPEYAFANGPTAKMIFPPPIGMNLSWGYTVISPNNRTAKFFLDSSNCTDPFYLPMQFSWVGYVGWDADPSAILFTDTNAMTTKVFNLGAYIISLQASDSIATGQPFYFYINVITAGQAVDSFIAILKTASIPENRKRVLIKVLSEAARFFDHGKMKAGCAQLETYMRLVKTSHHDSQLTSNLLRPAQDVIDAFQSPHHGLNTPQSVPGKL